MWVSIFSKSEDFNLPNLVELVLDICFLEEVIVVMCVCVTARDTLPLLFSVQSLEISLSHMTLRAELIN